jgi:hypothetical protein
MLQVALAFERIRVAAATVEANQDFPSLRAHSSDAARTTYFAFKSIPEEECLRVAVALVSRTPNVTLEEDNSDSGRLCRKFADRQNNYNEFMLRVLRVLAEHPG